MFCHCMTKSGIVYGGREVFYVFKKKKKNAIQKVFTANFEVKVHFRWLSRRNILVLSRQRRMCFSCEKHIWLAADRLSNQFERWKHPNMTETSRSSCVSLPPLYSSPMTQRSTLCFSERWLPVQQHLGFQSRHLAKRRRKTNQTGFSFPFDEKQTGVGSWEGGTEE